MSVGQSHKADPPYPIPPHPMPEPHPKPTPHRHWAFEMLLHNVGAVLIVIVLLLLWKCGR